MRTMIVLLAGLFFAALPGFGEGYLPVIGPAPLRFLPEPIPVAKPLLPPLNPPIPPAAALEEDDDLDAPDFWPEFANANVSNATNEIVIVAQSPLLPGTEANLNLSTNLPPANELITPGVLLHYFHQRFGETNDPVANPFLPFLFVPPQSGQSGPRPSSKAAYSGPGP